MPASKHWHLSQRMAWRREETDALLQDSGEARHMYVAETVDAPSPNQVGEVVISALAALAVELGSFKPRSEHIVAGRNYSMPSISEGEPKILGGLAPEAFRQRHKCDQNDRPS